MHKLVLVRHGESQWNKKNQFTGWADVDLEPSGVEQAKLAAERLKEAGYTFDVAYTSVLKRAIRTLWTILDGLNLMWIPEHKSWRLNERHYGALQGLNKAETAEKYGEDQVKEWRRGYAVKPPAVEEAHEYHPGNDARYQEVHPSVLPTGESLDDTYHRMLPYWIDRIAPDIKLGKQVIVVAHGNTLRALCKHLDGMSEEEVLELNIPVAQPLVYELDDDLKPIRHYYLAPEEEVAAQAAAVASQGTAKA